MRAANPNAASLFPVPRAHAAHVEFAGIEPTHVAVAPGTQVLAGHRTDNFGGMSIVAISTPGVAVAMSPRTDSLIRLLELGPGETHGTPQQITFDEVSSYHQDAFDPAASATVSHPAAQLRAPQARPRPGNSRALHIGGLLWTLIHRQLLSRATTGLDVTIVSDLQVSEESGYLESVDAAVSLAAHGNADPDAPTRARLAETCWQSAAIFSPVPTDKARTIAALRSQAEQLTLIDFADGAVSSVPAFFDSNLALLALPCPGIPASPDLDTWRTQNHLLAASARAFGVDSIRLLPDAPSRVLSWIDAVCAHHDDPDDIPTPKQARQWFKEWETQTALAAQAASALRSRDLHRALPHLNEASENIAHLSHPGSAEILRAAARAGTHAAWRTPATDGTVLVLVDASHADQFLEDLDKAVPGVRADAQTIHPAPAGGCVSAGGAN